jgi:cation:H+ antiporter
MAFFELILGLVLLIIGAELLVRGASGLALAVGMPSLIIGLTVVAFGTSSPELAVSLKASLAGQSGITLGNVLGSNIFNVLFILGTSALIAPLVASSQLVRLDVPVMIGVSGLTWIFALDHSISRTEGIILAAGAAVYTGVLIYVGKKSNNPAIGEPDKRAAAVKSPKRLILLAIYVLAGLFMLVTGARQLVSGAVQLAQIFGVSELVIGLTIVAAGTSMPEAATSIIAGIRGERDIAIGNIVGSNIFNILAVLGISSAVAPNGVEVQPAALSFDIPVMLAVSAACLPVFFTGGRISKTEGGLLLGYYIAYVTLLILDASEHSYLTGFKSVMTWFVIPLTTIGIIISVITWTSRRRDTG